MLRPPIPPPAGSVTTSINDAVSRVKRALAERRVLVFNYNGFERRVEPHALGLVADGKRALLGFQTEGGSGSEPPPGWRTFLLSDLRDLTVTRATFARPRSDYRSAHTGLKTVEAEVPVNARTGGDAAPKKHGFTK